MCIVSPDFEPGSLAGGVRPVAVNFIVSDNSDAEHLVFAVEPVAEIDAALLLHDDCPASKVPLILVADEDDVISAPAKRVSVCIIWAVRIVQAPVLTCGGILSEGEAEEHRCQDIHFRVLSSSLL